MIHALDHYLNRVAWLYYQKGARVKITKAQIHSLAMKGPSDKEIEDWLKEPRYLHHTPRQTAQALKNRTGRSWLLIEQRLVRQSGIKMLLENNIKEGQ